MIYVDEISPCLPNARWHYNYSCHLFSDNEQELHLFASQIGLKREWFQNHNKLPHYDLTTGKRKLAIRFGAIEATRQMVVDHFKPLPK